MNLSNDVKAPRKNWYVKSYFYSLKWVLVTASKSGYKFLPTTEGLLLGQRRASALKEYETHDFVLSGVETVKDACLQPAFRKNSGSFVFTEGYQTPRYPLGKKYIYIYAGKIKVLSLPQESITLMLLETIEGYLWPAMLSCTP